MFFYVILLLVCIMNSFRCRNFMCIWVSSVIVCGDFLSMFHCVFVFGLIIAFLLSCSWFCLCMRSYCQRKGLNRCEPIGRAWCTHTHTGQGLPIIILSGPTGGSHHNRWLLLQKKAAVYQLTLSTTALWQKDRAFKTFGQQETFGRLSYVSVTTFILIFVWQHSHLWQVKKPKINSLSCKFRKEFFHQDQNISLLDLRLLLTGCFTEIFYKLSVYLTPSLVCFK